MNTTTSARPRFACYDSAVTTAGGPYFELVDQLRRIALERTSVVEEPAGFRGWLRHATSWN